MAFLKHKSDNSLFKILKMEIIKVTLIKIKNKKYKKETLFMFNL